MDLTLQVGLDDCSIGMHYCDISEFPKNKGTFMRGPENEYYSILGSILPLFWETTISLKAICPILNRTLRV